MVGIDGDEYISERGRPAALGVIELNLVLRGAGANALVEIGVVAEFSDGIAVGINVIGGDFHDRSADVGKSGAYRGGDDRTSGEDTLCDDFVEALNEIRGGGNDDGVGEAVHFGHLLASEVTMAAYTVIQACDGDALSQFGERGTLSADVEMDGGPAVGLEGAGESDQVKDALVAFDSSYIEHAERTCVGVGGANGREGGGAVLRDKIVNRPGVGRSQFHELLGDFIGNRDDGRATTGEEPSVEHMGETLEGGGFPSIFLPEHAMHRGNDADPKERHQGEHEPVCAGADDGDVAAGTKC